MVVLGGGSGGLWEGGDVLLFEDSDDSVSDAGNIGEDVDESYRYHCDKEL